MKVVMLSGMGRQQPGDTGGLQQPALARIAGHPVLWHALQYLHHVGDHEFVLLAQSGDQAFRQYVRDEFFALDRQAAEGESPVDGDLDASPARGDWRIRLASLGSPSSVGNTLRRLSLELEDDAMLLTGADRLGNLDLPALEQFHRRHGRLATLLAVRPHGRYHRIETAGDQVVRCRQDDLADAFWVDGGCYLLEPSALDFVPEDEPAWEQRLLERLADKGQLMAYRHDGFWQIIEAMDHVQRLEQLWNAGKAPWHVWDSGASVSGPSQRKVLVTGSEGFLGRVVVPHLQAAGHAVTGLDSQLYPVQGQPGASVPDIPLIRADIRDVAVDTLRGFDAIIHLAGLSDDAVAQVRPEMTYDINYRGTVQLAERAKAAGVTQFLFPSSCGIYDAMQEGWLTEHSRLNPLTPYAIALALTEAELSRLADQRFSPTSLRLAEAYGVSPSFRTDLPINRLVGQAMTTGSLPAVNEPQWRPMIHVEDIARGIVTLLAAPRERIHNQILNVGSTSENYRLQDIITLLGRLLPPLRGPGPAEPAADPIDYRVSFELLRRQLPEYKPRWPLTRGLRQLIHHYREVKLTAEDLDAPPQHRRQQLEHLLATNQLTPHLRWHPAAQLHRRAAA